MRTKHAILMTVACLTFSGCVEREIRITTEPAGGLVYVSNVEVGRAGGDSQTPLVLPFTWYGDYDVAVRLEGYKTLKTSADIQPPWYEVPPLDLFSALAPWTYRDVRYLHYKLEKVEPAGEVELIQRSEELRLKNLQPTAGQ